MATYRLSCTPEVSKNHCYSFFLALESALTDRLIIQRNAVQYNPNENRETIDFITKKPICSDSEEICRLRSKFSNIELTCLNLI